MAKESTKNPKSKKTPSLKVGVTKDLKPLNKALGPAAEDFGQEVKPLGKEVGQLTVKVVRTLLIKPVAGIVSGIDSCGEWVANQVTDKLKFVPEGKIVEPEARIAWPALQACVYTGKDDEIREMFVNLLASDMNSDTKALSHPAFVEIIKQMTGYEARVLQVVKKSEGEILFEHRYIHPDGQSYDAVGRDFSFSVGDKLAKDLNVACSNLSRLGLMEITFNTYPLEDRFNGMKSKQQVELDSARTLSGGGHHDIAMYGIFLTPLGDQFSTVCL